MNKCPMVSTPEFPAECITKDCAWWDKLKHQCMIFSVCNELNDLVNSLDNHARSINQAVLMKLKGDYPRAGICPKCGEVMRGDENHRWCTSCGYSDPYK